MKLFKFFVLFFPILMFGQLDSNYTLSTYDSGYDSPMVTKFATTDDVLVLERTNGIKLNNQETLIVSSPSEAFGEGGNLGMAHLYFDQVHWAWIYSIKQDSTGQRYGSIDRYSLNFSQNNSLFDGNILDDFLTNVPVHYGGSIDIVDGWMFVSFGDNNVSGKAQLDDELNGKILRIDPWTGAGHPDNPLYDPNDPFSVESRTFAKGFRNPFRIVVIDVDTVAVYDVGEQLFEECTIVRAGDNGAWYWREGFVWSVTPFTIPNEKLPAFAYSHDSVDFETVNGTINYAFNGTSIIGGVKLSGFGYDGQHLFWDFFSSELLVADIQNDILVDLNSIGFLPQSFNVHATFHEGFIYITNLANGTIYQIGYGETLSTGEVSQNNRPLEVEYYNVLGQKIPYQKNTILIEKSVYENRIETKKIIQQ